MLQLAQGDGIPNGVPVRRRPAHRQTTAMDFVGDVGTEVAGGLLVAALVALGALVRSSPKRKDAERRLRRGLCSHDWQPIQTELGGGLRLVTQWQDECAKCGARR